MDPRRTKGATSARTGGRGGGERAVAAPARRSQTTTQLPDLVLGAPVRDGSWLRRLRSAARLEPGQVPKQSLAIPADEAQRVLRGIIRFVVDIAAETSTVLVWQRDDSELWVDVSTVTMTCADGLVRVGVKVGCDQLDSPTVMTVPIGVGTAEAPSGLVMSTVDRLDGPDLIVTRWSEAITAFAWEALLELARRLCAEMGRDGSGLPLIPGAIGAAKGVLLIQPVSRNDLSKLGG
jgi:hypothetical protein